MSMITKIKLKLKLLLKTRFKFPMRDLQETTPAIQSSTFLSKKQIQKTLQLKVQAAWKFDTGQIRIQQEPKAQPYSRIQNTDNKANANDMDTITTYDFDDTSTFIPTEYIQMDDNGCETPLFSFSLSSPNSSYADFSPNQLDFQRV